MLNTPPGPTLLGIDVIWVGSMLAAVAACAVMFAIYSAVTIRDPMAKRVKSLNARREQLKAGIVSPPSRKRASLVRKSETTDKIRDTMSSLKVLQDSQLKEIQQKLSQAGIRQKEYAFYVLLARMVLPIGLGLITALALFVFNVFPDWGSVKKVFAFGVMLGDDMVDSEVPCILQLWRAYQKHQKGVIALMEVPAAETGMYGIAAGEAFRVLDLR